MPPRKKKRSRWATDAYTEDQAKFAPETVCLRVAEAYRKIQATLNKMTIEEQIDRYISSQPEPKRKDMQTLHNLTLRIQPNCRLWFTDGKNNDGKVVSNPNIGYGAYTIRYADGTTKEFYRIGLSANTSGISVYVLGLEDKTYLARTYGSVLGKASVTGYCIKFKAVKNIDIDVLLAAIRYGLELPY